MTWVSLNVLGQEQQLEPGGDLSVEMIEGVLGRMCLSIHPLTNLLFCPLNVALVVASLLRQL